MTRISCRRPDSFQCSRWPMRLVFLLGLIAMWVRLAQVALADLAAAIDAAGDGDGDGSGGRRGVGGCSDARACGW